MKTYLLIIFSFFSFLSCDSSSIQKKPAKDPSLADTIFHPPGKMAMDIYRAKIEDYYQKIFLKTGFNGSILVAKDGQVVFEDYRGIYDFAKRDPITEHTPFHLASISKTFTGMTALKLWEQGRLSLDDSLTKFFPQLPYHGITVEMLLNHRSGLPNYLYFMDSIWNKKQKATNEDVLNFMIVHKPAAMCPPGQNYHYCNTNFILLALIVEQITKQNFPTYMRDSVFAPLGLKDTYVFSIADTAHYIPTYSVTRPFLMDHLDCTYGDKNIYSTVRDLFRWDKVLYENTFVQKSTAELAFTPYSNERRSMHNYGLAWHLYFNRGDTVIYHNGQWHGSNTVFTRFVQDTATIIVLGNKVNRNIYRAKEMSAAFTGKPDTAKLEE